MRPLYKGTCPQENNVDLVVTDYVNWRNHLIQRIGYYCVYCNMPLSHSLNVEHVVAKVPTPGEEAGDTLSWDNMLLACGPCNNDKSNQAVIFKQVYFPETNNTLIPFLVNIHPENNEAAIVKPADGLNEVQLARANRTIQLLGLNKIDNRPNIVDIRWKKRRRAMLAADAAYNLYTQIKEIAADKLEKAAEYVAINAAEIGFFLIWFEIFKDEPMVMEKLIDPLIIPGTAQDCFDRDNDYKLLGRNPMDNHDPI